MTTLPAAPATPALVPASDSGVRGDGITDVVRPTLTGTTTPGDTVTLYDNVYNLIGTATVSAAGAWSITAAAALVEGVHSFTATDTNAGGTLSASSGALAVTLITTPPNAPPAPLLAAFSDSGVVGDGITNVTRPGFTGTAAAHDTVTLYDAGTLIGTGTADASGTWAITATTTLPGGVQSVTATDTDIAGNVSPVSAPLVFTLLTTPPAAPPVPVLDPASDSGALNATNVTQPVIDGIATPGDTVTLYDGSALVGTAIAGARGAWSIAPAAPLAAGTHSFTATDTDVAGNVSARSAALSVRLLTTPPSATPTPALAAASDSGVVGDGITNVTRPTLTGTATPGDLITLADSGSSVGTATADAKGAWSITPTAPLAEGVHRFTATDTDAAGNISAASGTLTVTLVTTPPPAPPAPVLAPASDSGVVGDGITNVTRPMFTGTAVARDTVTLYDSGTLIGTGTADAHGLWSITATPALAGGVQSVTATDTDAAGNVSAASAPLVFTLLATPPPAPPMPLLDPASDSGAPNATNVTQPVIDGTATQGDIVTLYDGSGLIGTVTADAGGNWSIAPAAPLAAGTHSFTATDTDIAGNVSARSAALAVRLITTPPAAPPLPILAPASDSGARGDGLTNVTQPTLTGTATPGDLVTLADAGILVGTATASPKGAWSITAAAPLVEGVHSFAVTDTDAAGNVSAASGALTITLVTTPPGAPAAPLLDPASDSGLQGDGLTNVTRPTIDGTATAHDTVTLYDAGSLIGTGTADANGNWSITTPTLAAGVQSLTATDTDLAGNVSAASAPLVFTLLTTSPSSPLALTLDPASDSGAPNATNVTQPAIDGTATPGDTVTLTDSAALIGIAAADANGHWSIAPAAPLIAGTHSFSATDTDIAGNVSAASVPLVIRLITTPPNAPPAPVLAPASDSGARGDGITNVAQPTITGTAGPGDTVTLSDYGYLPVGTATADAKGAWSITAAMPLTEGPNILTATDTDAAGNISPASPPLTVTLLITPPPAPPAPTLAPASDSGVPGDGITNVTRPTITGTATPGDTVALTDGITTIGSATADANGNWAIAAATPLAAGAHTFAATDTDAAGNVSAASAPLVVTLLTTPPKAPPVPILAPSSDSGVQGDGLTNVTQPVITGTAVPGDLVTLTVSTSVIGTATVDTTGNWSITPAKPLAAGTYSFTASDTDLAGNVSARSPALAIRLITAPPGAPPAPVLAPSNGTIIGPQPTIDGSATAHDIVTLYDAGTPIGSTSADTKGAWVLVPTTAFATGSHSVTATDTDVAGNVSSASSPLVFTVGTTPAVTVPGSSSVPSGGSTATGNASTGNPTAGNPVANGVTVSGAGNATLTLPFDSAAGTSAAQALLAGLNAAVAAGTVVPYVNGAQPPALGAAQTGTLQQVDQPALLSMAATDIALIDDAAGPVTAFGGAASGALVASGSGGLSFVAGTGSGTVMAGGGANAFLAQTPGAGNWNVAMGGGDDTVVAGFGDDTIDAGAGSNLIFLGAGASSVTSDGTDTIVGGTGLSTVTGGTGTGVLAFAGGGGLDYTGGAGVATVLGLSASLTVNGGAGGGLFFAGSGGGSAVMGGTGAVTSFGGGSGDVLSCAIAGSNILAGGAGNETLIGAGSSGTNTFFAGSGNELISGGSGNSAFVAGQGSDTFIGGSALNLFIFASSHTARSDVITNFDYAHDFITLQGFAAGAAAVALHSAKTAGGNTTITLPDSTQITFAGIRTLFVGDFV